MKLAKVHYGWVICCACFVVMAFTAPLVNACASLFTYRQLRKNLKFRAVLLR